MDGLDVVFGSFVYRYVDILEKFGRDLFILDGDALLAYVLEEFADAEASFQLLPVVFRYEQVLAKLAELGAQFRVFFLGIFDSWGWRGECVCATRSRSVSAASRVLCLKFVVSRRTFLRVAPSGAVAAQGPRRSRGKRSLRT
jgi:hypothetical protein